MRICIFISGLKGLNVGKGHKETGKQRKLSAVVDQSVKAQTGMITQVKHS